LQQCGTAAAVAAPRFRRRRRARFADASPHSLARAIRTQDADGGPLSGEKRRKYCDVKENLEGAKLEPGLVYTFHFWQHVSGFGGQD